MKKVLLFVVLVILLTAGSVIAQNRYPDCGLWEYPGVYCIDNVKIGREYRIDGWGIIKIIKKNQGDSYFNREGYQCNIFYDGSERADELGLYVDITNLSYTAVNYSDIAEVKFIYDHGYEINGYWQQVYEGGGCMSILNTEDIEPYYKGHYWFGAKIPDHIVKDRKPLRMEVTLGDIVFIYHFR